MSIQDIANSVEREFMCSGLSDGLYFEFAEEVAKRHASEKAEETLAAQRHAAAENLLFLRVLVNQGMAHWKATGNKSHYLIDKACAHTFQHGLRVLDIQRPRGSRK